MLNRTPTIDRGLLGQPLPFMPGFPWQRKTECHRALSIIFNIIMRKQERKTVSKGLCIDCQQLVQEMEIQFENK